MSSSSTGNQLEIPPLSSEASGQEDFHRWSDGKGGVVSVRRGRVDKDEACADDEGTYDREDSRGEGVGHLGVAWNGEESEGGAHVEEGEGSGRVGGTCDDHQVEVFGTSHVA